jgi:membrane protein implicated in regulation of membrane protease activity
MEFDMAYWHWLVFGIVLVIAEIFIPSFTIFWFGLGAIVVGILKAIMPTMGFNSEIVIWILSSAFFTVAWFRYFKPRMIDKTTAGISAQSVIGSVGQVISAPIDEVKGQVRFTIPVLGSEEWEFICNVDVIIGDRVRIKEISGNSLIVAKA